MPKDSSYRIEIAVEAIDRMDLLRDIVDELSKIGANFLTFNANAHKDGTSLIKFLFQLSNLDLIDKIIDQLKSIDSVIDAFRISSGD